MKFHIAVEIQERMRNARPRPERRNVRLDTPTQRQVWKPTEEEQAKKVELPGKGAKCKEPGCAFPSLVFDGYCRHHGRLREGNARLVTPAFTREWAWIEAHVLKHAEMP